MESLVVLLVAMPGFAATRVHSFLTGRADRPWPLVAMSALLYDLPVFVCAFGVLLAFWGRARVFQAFAAPGAVDIAFWLTAIPVALGFAGVAGGITGTVVRSGRVTEWLVSLGVTNTTGLGDVWDEVLTESGANDSWVRVFLDNGRVYQGWLRFYSYGSSPALFLARTDEWNVTSWQHGREQEARHIAGMGVLIPGVKDKVIAIEFLDSCQDA
jgi:hypothetical protein